METQDKTVLTVENMINAAVEKVWEYWTKPEHITKWNNEMDYARGIEGSANQNRVNTIMSGINAAGLIAGAAYKGSNNSSWANGLFGNNTKANKRDFSIDRNPYIDANGNRVA